MNCTRAALLVLVLFVFSLEAQTVKYLAPAYKEAIDAVVSSKTLFVQLKLFSETYPNITTMIESEYFLVSGNNAQLLFVNPYTKLFTFHKLTQNFLFGYFQMDERVTSAIAANVTKEIQQAQQLQRQREIGLHWSKKLLEHFLLETKLGDAGYLVCYQDNEIMLDVRRSIFKEEPELEYSLVQMRKYYCCSKEDSESPIQCKPVTEGLAFTLVHVFLHIFRLIGVVFVVNYINMKLTYLRAKKFLLTNVTNWYSLPPLYLSYFIPKARTTVTSIRFGTLVTLVTSILIIYILGSLHVFTPKTWSDPSILSLTSPSLNKFLFIMMPLTIVFNALFTFLKALASRARYHLDESGFVAEEATNSVNLIGLMKSAETALRVAVLSAIGLIAAFIWVLLVKGMDSMTNFSTLLNLLTVFGLALSIAVHLISLSPQTWNRKRVLEILRLDQLIAMFSKKKQVSESSSNVDIEAKGLLSKKPKTVKEKIGFVSLYVKLYLPMWTLELLWLTTTFVCVYLAFTVVTRAIWSTLLLFIIDPLQIQFYIYIFSLLTTVWKFVGDLEKPYGEVKSLLINDKPVKSYEEVVENNNRVLNVVELEDAPKQTQKPTSEENILSSEIQPASSASFIASEDVETKTVKEEEKKEKKEYYIIMSWTHFLKLSDLINVHYSIRSVIIQLFLTIFILCVYFLNLIMFDVQGILSDKLAGKGLGGGTKGAGGILGGGNSSAMVVGLLSAGIMPLIPKIVEFFATNLSKLESTVFRSRYETACTILEQEIYQEQVKPKENAPKITPTFVVLTNLKASIDMQEKDEDTSLLMNNSQPPQPAEPVTSAAQTTDLIQFKEDQKP